MTYDPKSARNPKRGSVHCFCDIPPGTVFLWRGTWAVKLHHCAFGSVDGMGPNYDAITMNGGALSVPDGGVVRVGKVVEARLKTPVKNDRQSRQANDDKTHKHILSALPGK